MIHDLTGHTCRPRWHILQCMSGQERRLEGALRAADINPAYPVKEITWTIRGKKYTRTVPEVAGYVFAKFTRAPLWHNFRARNLITGVVWRETSHGLVPYEASGDEVRQFMGLPTRAEEIEAERQEAMRVRPGDDIEVFLPGDVTLAVKALEVRNGRVLWEAIDGMKGNAGTDRVRKMAAE